MLYEKYRPGTFKDMVGQEATAEILLNQSKKKNFAHSYLFSGTRGCGKTTSSRILAKAIHCKNPKNGEPCNECEHCKSIDNNTFADVKELNAASNNGVNEIRELINDVMYPPQQGDYKVYIIDEVHMLTLQAANAFLKTLEEPPEYVVFILATTDPQKLPVTILSRCQRYDFKRINIESIVKRLSFVCKDSNFTIDSKILKLIAKLADGAMRDALSLLEKIVSLGDNIAYDKSLEILGIVKSESLFNVSEAIIEKNEIKALDVLDSLDKEGKDLSIFISELQVHFRNMLISKISSNAEDVINMSQEDIRKLKKQCSNIDKQNILEYLKIVQELMEQTKWSSGKNIRVLLEMSIIKMCSSQESNSFTKMFQMLNSLSNEIAILKDKLDGPQQKSQEEVVYSETKLEDAKVSMCKIFRKFNKEHIASILEEKETRLLLKDNDILEIISPKSKILNTNFQNLTTGFRKNLNNPSLIIKFPELQ